MHHLMYFLPKFNIRFVQLQTPRLNKHEGSEVRMVVTRIPIVFCDFDTGSLCKGSFPVPVHAMKACTEIRGIAPLILNLGTRCRCGYLHAPADLPPEKNPGTHSRFGGLGQETISCPTGFRTPDRPARSIVAIPTTLSPALSHCEVWLKFTKFPPEYITFQKILFSNNKAWKDHYTEVPTLTARFKTHNLRN
jgi:hypothetical protein